MCQAIGIFSVSTQNILPPPPPPPTYFQSNHKVPVHTNSSNLHHTRRLLGSCYKIHIFFSNLEASMKVSLIKQLKKSKTTHDLTSYIIIVILSLTQELIKSCKSERIPFVTNWTHKLSGFQRILQYHYNEMVSEFPNLKCVFPEPPILSYLRNHNLRNLLVCSCFTPPSSSRPASNSSPCLSKRGKGCKLCHSISNSNFIINIQSGETCFTSGGRCNTSDTIYAAECTKHKLIYVGHSSQKLSSRFNGHRSDVNVKPKSCELAHHFHGNEECNINRHLKVYIL